MPNHEPLRPQAVPDGAAPQGPKGDVWMTVTQRRARNSQVRTARQLRDEVYSVALIEASWEGRQILLSAAEHSDCLDIGILDEPRYTVDHLSPAVKSPESFIEMIIRQSGRMLL